MPPADEVFSCLHVTNWNSWEDAGETYAKLVTPAAKVTDSVRRFVSDATKASRNEEERVAALYYAVATKIRYVALTFGASYGPHSAADTLAKGYGCCRDKAALLVAGLSELGIKAHLVLINASHQDINLDAPNPFFDHAIVAVPSGNDYLWLDPTSGNCTFGDLPACDQNKFALVCIEGGSRLVKTPLFPASRNGTFPVFDCQLTDDGNLEGTCTWKLHGEKDRGVRGYLKQMSPKERSEFVTQMGLMVTQGGARISDMAISNADDFSTPITFSFKFTWEGCSTEVGDLLMVKFPDLDADGLATVTAAKERKYPVAFPVVSTSSVEVRLRLPAGYQVQSLPKGVNTENAVGRYVSRYTVEGSVVKMQRESAIVMDRIPAADYPLFKELAQSQIKETRKQLVLKKADGS
jgi:hypothetical protein